MLDSHVSFKQAPKLRQAMRIIRADASMRVLMITGAGRGFCAGQDLSERMRGDGEQPADVGNSLDKNYNPLLKQLRALPYPVLCAVNGAAAGAGCNLVLACDIVIAARSATFIQAFSRIDWLSRKNGRRISPVAEDLAPRKVRGAHADDDVHAFGDHAGRQRRQSADAISSWTLPKLGRIADQTTTPRLVPGSIPVDLPAPAQARNAVDRRDLVQGTACSRICRTQPDGSGETMAASESSWYAMKRRIVHTWP
ncbi:MAG: enoyl-CoA hydratase-related protein [Betaproteobacteria bacterium]